jgi:glycerol-3-phosphate dehydrogenase
VEDAELVVIAVPGRSDDHDLAVELQHAINSTTFRVYVNNDPAGLSWRQRPRT